jgi:hypothetical protein
VAPLFDGGRRSVSYVFFEELLYGVVGFGGSSTSLPRGKELSLIGKPNVAPDRGEADAKEAGSLRLGHAALLDGLDYLRLWTQLMGQLSSMASAVHISAFAAKGG